MEPRGVLRRKDEMDVEVKMANLAEILRNALNLEVRDRAALGGEAPR